MTVWSGNTLFAVNKDLDSRQGVMHFCVKGNVTHQIAIRKAAEAYTQVTTRQVNEIVEAIRDLQRSGEEERKTAAQEWNNKIAELLRDYDDLRTQTRKLAEFKTHLFWSALGGALVLGFLLEGMLSLLLG